MYIVYNYKYMGGKYILRVTKDFVSTCTHKVFGYKYEYKYYKTVYQYKYVYF